MISITEEQTNNTNTNKQIYTNLINRNNGDELGETSVEDLVS